MDLPNLFTVNVAQAGQKVCVVILTSQTAMAGLLVVHASGSQMQGISEQISYSDTKSLLFAVDQALMELGKAASDVNDVVFCLEQSWFQADGSLLPDKQTVLKKLKEDLSLQPVGYVLQHETITEYLINQQRQLSALLLFLSAESVTATLALQGKVAAIATVGRSSELQSDVIEAFSRAAHQAGSVQLPGKILCASIALEVAALFELQQDLLTVPWPETVRFLQSPVIEVLKPQLGAQIVVTGAGKALQQLDSSTTASTILAPAGSGPMTSAAASAAGEPTTPAATTAVGATALASGLGERSALAAGLGQGLAEGLTKGLGEELGSGSGQGLGEGLAEGLGSGSAQEMGERSALAAGLGEGLGERLSEELGSGSGQGLAAEMGEGLGAGLTEGSGRALSGTLAGGLAEGLTRTTAGGLSEKLAGGLAATSAGGLAQGLGKGPTQGVATESTDGLGETTAEGQTHPAPARPLAARLTAWLPAIIAPLTRKQGSRTPGNQGRHSATPPSKKQLVITSALAAVGGVVIVLLIGYLTLTWTATVEVRVEPKSQLLTQEVNLTLDPTLTETDVAQRKLRAQQLAVELSGSGETQASGIKIVGDKAKGDVTLYNKTTAPKTFAAGTTLTTDKLVYLLDEAAEVPAATISAKPGGTGEDKEYGQKTVKVTAKEIGIEHNIDKDKALNIADFDSNTYAAKTATPLSGGSSREVRVISQTDLDVLLGDVKKDLLAQAKKQLEAQQGQDQRVIPIDAVTVVKKNFTAKEGDEVDSVKLELTIKAIGLAYYTADLVPIAQQLLGGLVPSGYTLDGHTPQILSAGTASGSGQVAVAVNLSSKAHALIEPAQLKAQLKNQSLAQAAAILKNNTLIEKASVLINPSLARAVVRTVPADDGRVVVKVNVPQ